MGGDTYELRYQIEDEKTGRNRTKTKRVHCASSRAAQKLLDAIHNGIDKGEYKETSKMLVKDLLNKWMENFASKKAGTTYDGYAKIVRNHLIPNFGDYTVDRLNDKHINTYLEKLQTSGRYDGRPGGLSAMSIKHIHAVFSEALKYAVKLRIINSNPADDVTTPKVVSEEMQVLTPDELMKLFDACKNSIYGPAIELAGRTGMRRGEILALKFRDVDFDKKTISINRALAETEKGIVVKDPKTKRSRRLISIDDETVALLQKVQKYNEQEKSRLKGIFRDQGWVFTLQNGNHWVPKNLSTAFREIIRKAGVPIIRFHDLRHTHATILLMEGVNVKIVSERLGHSSVAITLDTYSHVLPYMQDEAMGKFSQALRTASEKSNDAK